MKCDKAQQAIIDVLTEHNDLAPSDELTVHLESCTRCRRAATELNTLWTRLGDLDPPTLGTDRVARLRESLDTTVSSAFDTARSSARAYGPRLVAAAALIVGMVVGGVIARSRLALRLFPVETRDQVPPTVSGPGGGLFLFMLHRPEGPLPDGRAARYQQWADDLRARNQLVHAGALQSSEGWMLTRENAVMNAMPLSVPAGIIEGFFLIAAPDSAAVVNAARISPHFDYGGAIEVRRVVN